MFEKSELYASVMSACRVSQPLHFHMLTVECFTSVGEGEWGGGVGGGRGGGGGGGSN